MISRSFSFGHCEINVVIKIKINVRGRVSELTLFLEVGTEDCCIHLVKCPLLYSNMHICGHRLHGND